ncbi:MAG: ABC transporter substrate-binding protein [Dehalococcoidia bacterium]|nr:ABC transporter substrate-binding protein [Dehalococcoidia bacterium]
MEHDSSVSRRGFIRTTGLTGAGAALAAACAPAATPAQAPAAAGVPAAPAAWEAEWERTLTAANKEGRLDLGWIQGPYGSSKPLVDDFAKAFPGITPERTSMTSGSLMVPKIVQEHKAGVYSFDLIHLAYDFAKTVLAEGALQPLRPHIFRPDVLDDKAWKDGFEGGWLDPEKQYGYAYVFYVVTLLWVNSDLVKDGEIKTAQDMLDPKWRGKIIMEDPRSGRTYATGTALRLNLGDDFLKKLIVDQKPVFSRDTRLITEAMVRGQYAFGTGVVGQALDEFKAQGLGKNIKQLNIPEAESISPGFQAWMLKGAPHPNAAKVFLNWFLTREGQTAYNKSTEEPSRRLDVPPVVPGYALVPGRKYVWISSNPDPVMAAEIPKTTKLMMELAGIQ